MFQLRWLYYDFEYEVLEQWADKEMQGERHVLSEGNITLHDWRECENHEIPVRITANLRRFEHVTSGTHV